MNRRLQFNLRALLVATTVVAGGMGAARAGLPRWVVMFAFIAAVIIYKGIIEISAKR